MEGEGGEEQSSPESRPARGNEVFHVIATRWNRAHGVVPSACPQGPTRVIHDTQRWTLAPRPLPPAAARYLYRCSPPVTARCHPLPPSLLDAHNRPRRSLPATNRLPRALQVYTYIDLAYYHPPPPSVSTPRPLPNPSTSSPLAIAPLQRRPLLPPASKARKKTSTWLTTMPPVTTMAGSRRGQSGGNGFAATALPTGGRGWTATRAGVVVAVPAAGVLSVCPGI